MHEKYKDKMDIYAKFGQNGDGWILDSFHENGHGHGHQFPSCNTFEHLTNLDVLLFLACIIPFLEMVHSFKEMIISFVILLV